MQGDEEALKREMAEISSEVRENCRVHSTKFLETDSNLICRSQLKPFSTDHVKLDKRQAGACLSTERLVGGLLAGCGCALNTARKRTWAFGNPDWPVSNVTGRV